ncbi:MAG: hypothetical protein ACK6DG_13215, partial [Cyanobacteriota bacterium]
MSLVVGACKVNGGEQSPPQQLPIEAQWCLPGAPRRCSELDVPATPRLDSRGLQLSPGGPPRRGPPRTPTPGPPGGGTAMGMARGGGTRAARTAPNLRSGRGRCWPLGRRLPPRCGIPRR